jgi:protein phosphatase
MSRIEVCAISNRGRVRARNEDCFLVAGIVERDAQVQVEFSTDALYFREHGFLCAVADGMGGHEGGDVASRSALTYFAAHAPLPVASCNGGLERAISETMLATHNAVNAEAEREPSLVGMGTTLTGVLLSAKEKVLFHAGDSRLYRFRDGAMHQMTTDDSIRGETKGPLTNSIAGGRNVACSPHVEGGLSVESNDLLLLCTDGLTDVLDEAAIVEIMSGALPVPDRAAKLVVRTLDGGARDNVTVVLIRIGS